MLASLCALMLVGCSSKQEEPPRAAAGLGPLNGTPLGAKLDQGQPALLVDGPYSKQGWSLGWATLPKEAVTALEIALRQSYAADISLRDYAEAKRGAEAVLADHPQNAAALVIQALASFHLGGELAQSLEMLGEAESAAPSWGVPAYEIAYLSAMMDREQGRAAFERARELGVLDTRSLGPRFYDR